MLIADSALEDHQAQVSRSTPISAIPVRSLRPRKGVTGPADHRWLAGGWLIVPAYANVRDEEATGSKPTTPKGNGRLQGI
jgi:hypothetical protein